MMIVASSEKREQRGENNFKKPTKKHCKKTTTGKTKESSSLRSCTKQVRKLNNNIQHMAPPVESRCIHTYM
jgi:hypothetical protein